jgi:hypothetical protein
MTYMQKLGFVVVGLLRKRERGNHGLVCHRSTVGRTLRMPAINEVKYICERPLLNELSRKIQFYTRNDEAFLIEAFGCGGGLSSA